MSSAVAVADLLGCCHDTRDLSDSLCLRLASSVLHDFVGDLQSICSAYSGAYPRPFTTSFAQENFLHPYGVHLMLECIYQIEYAASDWFETLDLFDQSYQWSWHV